jgi:deazaflavin-dependent oxidoreductase (nitroreductase family)
MLLPKSIRDGIRSFNKHLLNRLIRKFAGYSPTSFALIRHVGRRSGKAYETPIIVEREGDDFVIALTYGTEVDWYRNVVAAGRCNIIWHSQDFTIDHIETMDVEKGLSVFAFPKSGILRFLGIHDFVRMTVQAVEPARKAA